MSDSESDIELEIQAKGLTAPRLSPDQIDYVIHDEIYHLFNGRTTVCCLVLANGCHVIGSSSCVSEENFDEDIGRKVARRNARDKIWALEGYLLLQRLHDVPTKVG